MENIHLVTVATHNEGYYNALKESAKRNNYNLITLGWGQKWGGFIMKYKLLQEVLNNFDDNDIIILIDAYDVIVNNSKDVILERFKKFNKPLLLSKDGEPGNAIFKYAYNKIFDSCRGTNICAGLMMGYVWAFKLLIVEMCGQNLSKCGELNLDDQIILVNVCNNNEFYRKYLAIDYNNYVFFNTFGTTNFEIIISEMFTIRNDKLYIKNADYSPCFIHGPGNVNLNNICKFYNLPLGKKISRDMVYRIKLYTKPQYMSRFKDEIYKIIILFVVIISVLIGLYMKDTYYKK